MAGAAAYPRTEARWRKNPDGKRTLKEALAIGRRHELPVDDHAIVLGEPRHFPNGELAVYGVKTTAEVICVKDFVGPDERAYIRLNPAILDRDDAILAVLIHELHEIEKLIDAFAENGGRLTKRQLLSLIDPRIGTLHDEAWDRADQVVGSLIDQGTWP